MKLSHVVDTCSSEPVSSACGHAGAPSAAAALGWRAARSAARHQRQLAPGVGPRRQCKKSWRVSVGLPAVIVLALVAAACSAPPPPGTKDHAAKGAQDRSAKDAMFEAGDDPVAKARHAEFLPLAYFPIDPDYDVPAV